jgi:Electron transfer DM13
VRGAGRSLPPWRSAVVVGLVIAIAGCGDDDGDGGGRGEDAFSAVEREELQRGRELRAAPRWEPIAARQGTGSDVLTAEVDPEAVRWRVRWNCRDEDYELSVDDEPVETEGCPGAGQHESVTTGQVKVAVTGSSPWEVVIEQEVERPLHEPPLPEIESGRAVALAEGSFYEIERRGRGTARLYRLPNGRLALRLDRFGTSANTDLFVWLSESPMPRTTKEVLAASHVEVALLKSTVGDQNYLLPAGDPSRARSVVIWCRPLRIAYTAAALHPANEAAGSS